MLARIISYSFLAILLSGCKHKNGNSNSRIRNLKLELDSIYYNDQHHREEIINLISEFGQESTEVTNLWCLINQLDSINQSKVKSILTQYGWPSDDSIGIKRSKTIFLVIQHAELHYQKQLLPLVTRAFVEGKIENRQMALFKDRISIRENGFQVYGTQLKRNDSTKLFSLYPLTYPNKIDSLRTTMGLDSLHIYLSLWNLESQ
jgi:hypothetical protein